MSSQASTSPSSPTSPAPAEASAADIDRACRAAAAAAAAFRARPAQARAELLERIATELEAEIEGFAQTIPRETSLPEARARGELARTTGQLRLFAAVVRAGDYLGVRIDHADARRSPPRPDLRQYRVPLGPVAVFGASNFPLAFSVAGGDTASALAAGCPVVVKAHPGHPLTSDLAAGAVRRAVQACGMPEGVFSMVHGAGHDVGRMLVEHPLIAAVAFTGSFAGGTALARAAQARAEPIPVYAEMGSVNPMFVLPGALARDPAALARAYLGSLSLGAGQFCTNPGLVFAQRGEALESFCTALAEAARQQPAQAMLGAGILAGYRAGTRRVSEGRGVHLAAAGENAGDRVAPQVFRVGAEDFLAQPKLAEEVFGPTGLIVEVDDAAGMPELARALAGQLTATVHAEAGELEQHAALVAALEGRVGRLLFNAFPTGVEVCHAMVHGGPWPATTAPNSTSVGTLAIERFLRPVCYQDCPDALLPEALREANPLGLRRLVDGRWDAPATH
ncbi:aldehyde dehydrogenase (NADP(+)) [Thiomonas sp.]|uniref:aldehyde dehydrogenase (NADP(+)) n=1 Tax=Thiomonas sp. TaxID=2047785 RepID=UPI00260F42C5|nr:aldehyde dehydrogenase (NADP(+)) [Thiomonas sp.]